MTTYIIHVRCLVCGELHLVSRESYTDQPPVNDLVWCEEVQDYIKQPDPEQWLVQSVKANSPNSNSLSLSMVLLVLLGLASCLVLLGRRATSVKAATINVHATGTDGPTCGSESDPCRTIPYAVDNRASSGDVVFVGPGMYIEPVTMKPGVVISGAGSAVTFIDGENTRGPMILANSADVTSTAIVQGFTIRRGYATDGAALSITANASPVVKSCIISDNLATNNGGGLYVDGSVTLSGTQVISNTAELYGGGMFQRESTEVVQLIGGLFERNVAKQYDGGGLYVYGSTVMTGTRVISNTAGREGGGLFVNHDIVATGVQVIGNTAGRWGGGLYQNLLNTTVILSNSRFEHNASDFQGGGMWLTPPDATLIETEIISNTAGEEGGGIYLQEGANISGTVVASNTAGISGGGLYSGGPVVLTDTQILTNSAQSATGGGAYVKGNVVMSRTQVVNNTTATNGGGLYQSSSGAGVQATDSRFERNEATTGDGGGLRSLGSALLRDSQVLDNSARWGGGLRVEAEATLIDTVISGNTASEWGGGLHQARTDQTVTVIGGSIDNNDAILNEGGGLYIRGTATLTGTQVLNNSATERGGGLYALGTARATNTVFADNASPRGAGIFLFGNEGAPAVLRHVTVANATMGSGSAVEVSNGTVGITNTIITSYTYGIQQTGGSIHEDYNLYYGNGSDFLSTGGTLVTGVNSLHGQAPLFVDPAGGDFHLLYGSPAVDAGTDVGVPDDIDGDSRPQLGGYDIGADEYWPPGALQRIYLPLVFRNAP